MRKYLIALLSISIIGLFPLEGSSVPVLGAVWQSVDAGWAVRDAGGSGSSPSVTPSGSTVTMTFAGAVDNPQGQLYAANFGGNYSGLVNGGLEIHFTLSSPNVAPNPTLGLAFYFTSPSGGGGGTWLAQINPVQTTGTQRYSISIGNPSFWYNSLDNPSVNSVWTDFANVSEIGFQVLGGNSGGVDQNYEFSDISFFILVPEPETVWVIMMVLASLMITFRVRIGEMISQVKSQFVV